MEPSRPFPVEMDPRAVAELARQRDRKGDPSAVVRIGVKGGGCSGLEYVVRLEPVPREGDHVAEFEGLRVVCDRKSAEFLSGSRLVWNGNLMTGGLTFENPNAARSCGCGTSFMPKAG